jgi:site-specific recombinase XerD
MTAQHAGFPALVQAFFEHYLPTERNLSSNTVLSYRDAMILFFQYAEKKLRRKPDQLEFEHVDVSLVRGFLDWLQRTRGCKPRTCNQRLAALKSFFRFVASVAPEHLERCRQIRELRNKRVPHAEPAHLEPAEVQALLHGTTQSRAPLRDLALVTLLYNTGARVQELVDMNVGDLILEAPPRVRIQGKGRKERTCPLWATSVEALRRWIASSPKASSDSPLFLNARGDRLTRSGVAYVLKSLALRVDLARGVKPVHVAPHVIRHTTAMHLLRSGVDMIVIAAWLGHVNVSTTHGYVEIDLRMKQAAIAKTVLPSGAEVPQRFPGAKIVARLKAISRGQDYEEPSPQEPLPGSRRADPRRSRRITGHSP